MNELQSAGELRHEPTRPHESGQVLVDGQNLRGLHSRHIPSLRRNIGVVFQNHQLLFDRSVFDNVALPLIIAGYQPRDVSRRVRAALDKVGLLSKEKQMPVTLSGGEQQRVGIARAVVNKPKILLADEPTGNVDPEMGERIIRLFVELNKIGTTTVIATHDYNLISRFDGAILNINEGRLSHG